MMKTNLMKNLILTLAILIAIVSCNKDGDSGSNYGKIVIKGSISGSNLKSSGLKSANLIIVSRCQKVLVFNSTGYQLFNIEDNAFTAKQQPELLPHLLFLMQTINILVPYARVV
jgi:hypothetical protein